MVKINGAVTSAEGITVSEYLAENNYDPKRVAVELNGNILPKAEYDNTAFKKGDTAEIVSFVGGG